MLAKVNQLAKLSPNERNAKLKLAVHNRVNAFRTTAAYSTVGYWLNRQTRRFMLERRPDFHSDFDHLPDYKQLLDGWTQNNRANYGDLTRFYTIYLNVSQVLADLVPGDFVELGVYKGNSAQLLGTLARRQNRHLYLFDTFQGFDQRDLKGKDEGRSVLFADTSLSAVRKCVGTEGVTYIPGFFPQSLSQISPPSKIAVAHIDCDLYEPMKAGLEWFYPRLSTGGVLLLHDYSSGHWPGAKSAIDEFFATRPEKPLLAADKSGTALIRRIG